MKNKDKYITNVTPYELMMQINDCSKECPIYIISGSLPSAQNSMCPFTPKSYCPYTPKSYCEKCFKKWLESEDGD